MVSNKWLPLDKYKIYANTDKIVITLRKGLLIFNNFDEDIKLTVNKEFLEISEITTFYDDMDDIVEKKLSWKIKLGLKNFIILKESLKDSFNYSLNITDVAPARIECFSNDVRIYNGQFNDRSKYYIEFLELSLKSPILRKKFGLYRFNKYYDKKKTSFNDDLPF